MSGSSVTISRVGRLSGRRTPWGMLVPMLALAVVFGLVPLVHSAWLMLHRTSGPGSLRFVGLRNIIGLWHDREFLLSMRNTLVFVIASLVVQVPLGLGLALVSARLRGWRSVLLRALVFGPNLVGAAFAAVIFAVLLEPRFGPVSRLLGWAARAFPGADMTAEPRWLSDPSLVLPTTVAVAAWVGVGFNTVFFHAALRSVPRGPHEAALLAGAGAWTRFWSITLPAIRPVAVFLLVLNTVLAFRVFELPWILQRGTPGPDKSALFVVTYLYETGFVRGDLGAASAIGWVITVVVVVLALAQNAMGGSWRATR